MDSTKDSTAAISDSFVVARKRRRRGRLVALIAGVAVALSALASVASAATPCDTATNPGQCAWLDSASLPPFVHDAILAKGGTFGAGNVLVLSSGDPRDPDSEISNDVNLAGCGTNPDGWETYDCTLMTSFVPPQDSVVLALSSEWFEWYQSIFTDWMTISGAGVATVDVSINSWINNKVDVIPYGPWETGVVLLTSLSSQKMVDFRVSDSGDHIYDTAIVVVPASWFSGIDKSGNDPTLLCGDNKLEPGEECDDGNLVADDGCSNLCLGSQPPSTTPPPAPASCGNLKYTWPTGTSLPYTCGNDLCGGFRCVIGDTISPACYTADQCAAACAGACVDVQAAQLDCSTMCSVQPPANQPPVVVAPTCDNLSYVWPDGTSMPYSCDDECHGQRCVTGGVISTECFKGSDCDATTCPGGTCVDTPPDDCATFCAAAQLPSTCTEAEKDDTRLAANQNGPCHGNLEICKSSGLWKPADGSYDPKGESCNGIDDDCNGVADDMFVTCGDFGLCQNTVNTCDPANPSVPVVCSPLPAPSPVEICNNGLDDDCEGAVDDGCECGDGECMPGEDWANCQADCPMPVNGTPCDDTNFCTKGETWQNGVCAGGADVTCESENACLQAGTCIPSSGCSATKVNCDDGVACTADTCDSVSGCLNTPDDSACADGDPCTIDTCDALAGCGHAADPLCGGQDLDTDGYVSAADGGDDCDDADANVNPGAVEACNGIDDNCDTNIDEGYGTGDPCSGAANDCGTTIPGMYVCLADTTGVECNAPAATNPAGYGDACESAANSCGTTNAGTIGCDGSCSATVPADPANLGNACESAANSCGTTNAGTIGCDGSCSATVPADPANLGNACESAANSCGTTNAGTIGCDGSCSATAPADPANLGNACESAANSCGTTNAGTIGCDGSCSATVPADPANLGNACESAANSCGTTNAGTIGCDGSCSATVPADPANLGNACESAANSCGTTNAGTIGCDGSCSATVPADPADLGNACESASNSCGTTNAGTIGCDGSCSATVPADPDNLGDACQSAANACGATGAGQILCDGTCDATVPVAADGDGDGTADCIDACPADPAKIVAGDCGCGVADTDENNNSVSDCLETASADLGITAEPNTRKPTVGKHLRVRWEVTNAGPDSVEPGATVAGSITGGAVTELRLPKGCSGTPEAFACDTTALLPGRRRPMKVQVVPSAASTLVFTLTVSGPLLDPNPANQTATVEVVVP